MTILASFGAMLVSCGAILVSFAWPCNPLVPRTWFSCVFWSPLGIVWGAFGYIFAFFRASVLLYFLEALPDSKLTGNEPQKPSKREPWGWFLVRLWCYGENEIIDQGSIHLMISRVSFGQNSNTKCICLTKLHLLNGHIYILHTSKNQKHENTIWKT